MSMTAQLERRYGELKQLRAAEELRRKQQIRDQLVQAFVKLTGQPPEGLDGDRLMHEGMVFRYSEHWYSLELRVPCPHCQATTWIVVRDFDTLALVANDREALAANLPIRHRERRCLDRRSVRPLAPRPKRDGTAAVIVEH